MNFALLNFVLDAVRDSSSLVCIASSKIPVLLQNYVACLLIQGVKNVVCFFSWDIAWWCCVLTNVSAIVCFFISKLFSDIS